MMNYKWWDFCISYVDLHKNIILFHFCLFIYLVYCWLQSFQLIDLTEVETYTIHQNFHVFVCVFFRSRGMTLVRVWTSPPPCRLWGEPSPWTEGPLSQSRRWVFPAWSRSRVQCTASMTVKGWDNLNTFHPHALPRDCRNLFTWKQFLESTQ